MKKHILSKFLLLSALLGGANSVWAQEEVPDPVYFNDFSTNVGVTQHGSGRFDTDADDRFGRFYQNDPNSTNGIRQNYLLLPDDVLSHSASTNEMTIGFWVNKKIENDFFFSPLFSAYGEKNNPNTYPMLVCETRGLIQLNCEGYCDFGIYDVTPVTPGTTYNDGTPYVSTAWLDDGEWHYYTITLTSTKAKVYIDGVLINGWTVDGTTSDGQKISGLFSNGSDLKYVCLGGNQAWDWNDADPSFGFDDFAVYDKALSADQITQIIKNKWRHEYTVDGIVGGYNVSTTVGEEDKTSGWNTWAANSLVFKKGQTYKVSFTNQGKGASGKNYNNWVLKFNHNSTDFCVRADYYAFTGKAETDKSSYFVNRWKYSYDGGTTSSTPATPPSEPKNEWWTQFKTDLEESQIELYITYTTEGTIVINGTMTSNTTPSHVYYYNYKWTEKVSGDVELFFGVDNCYLENISSSAVANTGANGITTFSSSYHLDLDKIKGATAYYVSEASASSATLTEATGTVAAGEGLFLKGEPNTEVTIPLAASGTAISGNMLKGSPVASTIDNRIINYDNIYVLGATDGQLHNVATYVGTNTLTIPAGKAFLRYSGSASRQLALDFGNEPTGISAMTKNVEVKDNAYFDLQGRRVAQPRKGLYIVNGKKVVIK